MRRISKSGRGTYEEKGKRPGPGQYPVKSSIGTKGVSIAGRVNSGSFMGKGNGTPGPGQYSNLNGNRPKTAGGAFGVKTGSSLSINPQTSTKVGPGAYTIGGGNKSMNRTQDKGFGTATGRGMPINSSGPGPGQYSTSGRMDKENAVGFGRSTRNESKKNGTPGPGMYTHVPRYPGADGVTMKSRTSFGDFMPKNQAVPGPGQYNPDISASKGGHRGSGMGQSVRSNLGGNSQNTPGPGSHNTTNWDTASRAGNGSTFGPKEHKRQADRGKDLISNSKTPGPGAYNVGRNSLHAPSYSMSGAKYSKDLSYAPGPG